MIVYSASTTILRPLLYLTYPAAEIKVQGKTASKYQRQDEKQPDEQDGQKGSRGASQYNGRQLALLQMSTFSLRLDLRSVYLHP